MVKLELQKEQLSWYESNLSLGERKKRGHFSTPPALVKSILDACGYTPEANLKQVRVLDPACGSGNFLVGAAQRLVGFSRCIGLAQEEHTALISRNLWGLDPDPVACFLAEMQLRALLEDADTQLHIHQADALALPWEPCVDLFVANPPYLAAKNNDLSGYRSAQRGQSDSYLLFLNLALQIVRRNGWVGLVLPDPVLARSNATNERANLLEKFTIHHLWHLSGVFAADVGAVVMIAQKKPPQPLHQLSWQRERWQSISKPQECQTNTVSQALFLRQPSVEFRYLLSSGHGTAIEQLRARLENASNESRNFAPLQAFLSIARGEELGKESAYLTQNITWEGTSSCRGGGGEVLSLPDMLEQGSRGRTQGTRKGPRLRSPAAPASTFLESPFKKPTCVGWDRVGTLGSPSGNHSSGFYPVLRGGVDIQSYSTPRANWWIAREGIKKPVERYLAPKLLVVKSTGRLQATLDMQGHIALQTLYLLHLRQEDRGEDTLYFFLALLNSRLLRDYVYILHTAYKWVQPQIEQHVLAKLPVPIVEHSEKQEIIERAKLLVDACSEPGASAECRQYIDRMYEEQERAICELYGFA